MSQLRWAIGMVLWVTVLLPLWLLTEGVSLLIRLVMDSHSPSGY